MTVVNETARLLAEVGEMRASKSLEDLAQRLVVSSTESEEARRDVARSVLQLYGGMGSFGDLVLQDARGVLPQQADFDRLRRRLFVTAVEELDKR